MDKKTNINDKNVIDYYNTKMEDEIEIHPQKVPVSAGDLLKKFKSGEDRYNFMREMSK